MTTPASLPTPGDNLSGQPPSAAAIKELAALRQAVGLALDRKRRLGQYAVVSQDGQVRKLPPEALPVWPAEGAGAGAPSSATPLAQVLAAWEPLPGGLDEPADPPPQALGPL